MTTPEKNPTGSREFKVFVDFDATLFDTRRFARDLWQGIADESGTPYEHVQSDANQYKLDPVLGGYDLAAHLASYSVDSDKMWVRLAELLQHTDYLYEDSTSFMQALLAEGYQPGILSFGEKHFQEAKILPSLARLVGTHSVSKLPVVITTVRKGRYIAEMYPDFSGVLVDDVPDQNLPDGFTEIHLDRTAQHATPAKKLDGFVAADLMQALQVIRSF